MKLCMISGVGMTCGAGWLSDRRCFPFLHPALPDELLIFVEVALTRFFAAVDSISRWIGSREPFGARFTRRYRGLLFDQQLPRGSAGFLSETSYQTGSGRIAGENLSA